MYYGESPRSSDHIHARYQVIGVEHPPFTGAPVVQHELERVHNLVEDLWNPPQQLHVRPKAAMNSEVCHLFACGLFLEGPNGLSERLSRRPPHVGYDGGDAPVGRPTWFR